MSDFMMPLDVEDDESEAATEMTSKPKRGRPRTTPPEFDSFVERLDGDKSRRTTIKRFHTTRALTVLGEDERFAYIVGPDRPRMDILAELGRIEDDERLREAAAYICLHKLKTKEALPAIRRYRLGRATPGNALVLAGEIGRTIQDYSARHPGMTPAKIRMALKWASEENCIEMDESDATV